MGNDNRSFLTPGLNLNSFLSKFQIHQPVVGGSNQLRIFNQCKLPSDSPQNIIIFATRVHQGGEASRVDFDDYGVQQSKTFFPASTVHRIGDLIVSAINSSVGTERRSSISEHVQSSTVVVVAVVAEPGRAVVQLSPLYVSSFYHLPLHG